jgi:tRNA(fMet)-specific endonuclease VapC
MFVILDTNHYREMLHETKLGGKLSERLRERDADAFTTIVTVQEITQGWTAEINRCKTGRDQVRAYEQFENAIHDFADITILAFDSEAAEIFHAFPASLRRIGTMDLKIAAIACSHGALLLSRNLRDFTQVPGLTVENWLD